MLTSQVSRSSNNVTGITLSHTHCYMRSKDVGNHGVEKQCINEKSCTERSFIIRFIIVSEECTAPDMVINEWNLATCFILYNISINIKFVSIITFCFMLMFSADVLRTNYNWKCYITFLFMEIKLRFVVFYLAKLLQSYTDILAHS